MVAEDEDSSYRVIDRILNEYGIETVRAVNGKEATDLAMSVTDLRLVFMDIKMPVMNGIQATRIIKKNNPQLPVIATTAFAMPGDQQIFREAGCDDFLSKPLKENQLITIIDKYLQRS